MSVISFIWMKKKVWYVRNTWGLRMEIYILQLYMPKTVVPNLSRRIVILLIMSIQNHLDLLNDSGAIYYFIFWDFLAHNVNFTTKIQTSTFLLPFFLVFYEVMIEHFSMQFAQFLYTSRSRTRILSFLKMRAFLSRNIIHRRCMSNTFCKIFLKTKQWTEPWRCMI